MDQKMLFSQCNLMYDFNIFKRKKMDCGCLRNIHLVFQSPITITMPSLIMWNSPELRWILSYEPVHVKAVVKLDGGTRKGTKSWVIQPSGPRELFSY